VVVTGNEDGAHHVISEIAGGVIDLGFTIPGQAWTYWDKGPRPRPRRFLPRHRRGQGLVALDRGSAAANLAAVARALAAQPLPAPPS
jgi:hypothetical protein